MAKQARQLDYTPPPPWIARPYQQDSLDAFDGGLRRQMLIWHRRAGKDNHALHLAAREAEHEVGTYWHLYPTHVQARRAIWNGIDKTGVRFLESAFPEPTRLATRKADMQIELLSGSMWQLCGSDRYDSLVGSNPRGVVFSEWALCDPRSWDYIRPIIRENGGWVAFITTYRGKNHAFRMAKKLANNPDWYVDVRTVEQTTDNDGNRILTDADIDAERAEGMSETLIQQEYYCNPLSSLPGAIYGRQMERLLEAKRLDSFAYDSSLPVFASWSLEFADQYTALFFQVRGNEKRVVGSKSWPFESLTDCLDDALTVFPWRYIARHVVPTKTPAELVETFENRGAVVELAPDVDSPYSMTRDALATTFIDSHARPWTDGEENNERLVDALNGYRFSAAESGQSYTATPVNSWEKYFARAFEVFSTYHHDEPLESAGGWHKRPSYERQDARVI